MRFKNFYDAFEVAKKGIEFAKDFNDKAMEIHFINSADLISYKRGEYSEALRLYEEGSSQIGLATNETAMKQLAYFSMMKIAFEKKEDH